LISEPSRPSDSEMWKRQDSEHVRGMGLQVREKFRKAHWKEVPEVFRVRCGFDKVERMSQGIEASMGRERRL